jgi:hypothetical protein
MNRRLFLKTSLAMTVVPSLWAADSSSSAAACEQAHAEIWRRFIDSHGVMIDFAELDGSVSLPTPEECRLGKPNALGWWSPIENGAMFNGMYMDAAVYRWQHNRTEADAAKARRLMEGLLFLASLSETPGFIARGAGTDGVCHYAMGSDDQTLPWFYGLWRYLESGLATAEEQARIKAKLIEVAGVLLSRGWSVPAEPPFGSRGHFGQFEFDSVPRLLFVCRLIYRITGDAAWEKRYREALAERGGKENRSRLEICERGMVFHYAPRHCWTSCTCVSALRALWEMETEADAKAAFARGLQASADLALTGLSLAEKFQHDDPRGFSGDWRTRMLPLWKPQNTVQEAVDLASAQIREFLKACPRRGLETAFVREPTASAWVVTLAPDPAVLAERASAVERVITRYDYSRLYYSQFFWVEAAWWRLRALG